MTAAYLLLAALAAIGFYLACGHQKLWLNARRHARASRTAASICVVLAAAVAIGAYGTWAGIFAAATAIMLTMVLLPYLDAWRQVRSNSTQDEYSDVG